MLRTEGTIDVEASASKRRRLIRTQKRFVNPIMGPLIRWGLFPSVYALIETTGRRTGKARTTPIGYGLRDDTFWAVAEHGRACAYVGNLIAEPRVRVRMHRRWRTGTAHVLHDDDGLARRQAIDEGNGLLGRLDGKTFRKHVTDPLTIRIDLDPIEAKRPARRRADRAAGRRHPTGAAPTAG